eukprot:PRCOL_00002132-RA
MSSALAAIGAEGVAPPTASRGGRTPSRGSLRGASTAGGPDELKLAMMDALVRKLRAKFPQDVTTQEVIGKEVTAFMKVDRPADQPVSEAELFALEKKIGKLLKMGAGGEWGCVYEYEAAMHAADEKTKKAKKLETAKRVTAELDKQVAEQQARRQAEAKAEDDYALAEKKQREEWAKEEAAKAKAHTDAIATLLEERDKQLAEQAAARAKEQRAKSYEEAQQREEARLEAERLREQEVLDRQAHREAGRKLLIVNEEVRLAKLERKKKEAELDELFQQQYADRLDQEEKRREQYTQQRQANMEARVGKAVAKPGRLYMDDEMVAMYQEKYNREQDEVNSQRQKRVEESNIEMRRMLAMQIKEKQMRKQQEAEREKQRVSTFLQEVKDLEEKDARKQGKLAEMRLKHKLDLEAQMAENFRRKFEQSMSDTEKSINRKLLSKAQSFAGGAE